MIKKQELTRIKEMDDVEQRVKNLEAIFSMLRDIKLKQKEDSSEDLINILSSRDPQWQFPKQTQEKEPKLVPIQTEEEDPLPFLIDVPRKTEKEDPLPINIPRQTKECQLISLGRLRKKTHFHLISSTDFHKLIQCRFWVKSSKSIIWMFLFRISLLVGLW
ncbi:hypothetical protein Tco_0732528 [Tanacetum coccineum]